MKPIKKVVITVPAYFDIFKDATIDAAKLANLEVIRIINEPTAPALSYGFEQSFCPFKTEVPSFQNYSKKIEKKEVILIL